MLTGVLTGVSTRVSVGVSPFVPVVMPAYSTLIIGCLRHCARQVGDAVPTPVSSARSLPVPTAPGPSFAQHPDGCRGMATPWAGSLSWLRDARPVAAVERPVVVVAQELHQIAA